MSSIHSGGVGTPGVPGPEAEIRRLKRRVLELEETCRAVHARNRELEAGDMRDALAAANASLDDVHATLEQARAENDRLRVGGDAAAREGARLSQANEELARERDEARATAATEAKRADHHAAEHAAAVKELAQAKAQKGGKR